MDKMKELVKYHLEDYRNPIILTIGIYLGMWLFTLQNEINNFQFIHPRGFHLVNDISVDSLSFIAIVTIVLIILILVYHQKHFKTLSQNGFTRKEMYLAKLFAISIISLITVIVVAGRELIYAIWLFKYFDPLILSAPIHYVFYLAIMLSFGVITTLIASLIHKLGVMKTIGLYIVLSYGILPLILNSQFVMSFIDKAGVIDVIFWWTSFERTGSLLSLFSCLISNVIFIALTYIIIQRTEITE